MMQKTMSSEAMQPTRKPHIRGVSEIQKPNTITNHTTIQKKELFSLTDNIKEDMFSLSNDSPFK